MAENKLADLSTDFAVKIIKLCETIKGRLDDIQGLRLDFKKRGNV